MRKNIVFPVFLLIFVLIFAIPGNSGIVDDSTFIQQTEFTLTEIAGGLRAYVSAQNIITGDAYYVAEIKFVATKNGISIGESIYECYADACSYSADFTEGSGEYTIQVLYLFPDDWSWRVASNYAAVDTEKSLSVTYGSCTDSDGDLSITDQYYTGGIVTETDINGIETVFNDQCGGPLYSWINEYTCDGNTAVEVQYNCANDGVACDIYQTLGACAVPSCTDSDGDLDIYIQQITQSSVTVKDVTGAETVYDDFCGSPYDSWVTEHTCDGTTLVATEYHCTSGVCSNGACVNEQSVCTDTDGDVELSEQKYTRGSVTLENPDGTTTSFQDYCNGTTVWEQLCPGPFTHGELPATCFGDEICYEGACQTGAEPTCTDSDGTLTRSEQFFITGSVTIGNPDGTTTIKDDFCDGRWVHEFECSGTSWQELAYQCGEEKGSCASGKCVSGVATIIEDDEMIMEITQTITEIVEETEELEEPLAATDCPGSIDIETTKTSYRIGENFGYIVYIYDSNGKPMPYYDFNVVLAGPSNGLNGAVLRNQAITGYFIEAEGEKTILEEFAEQISTTFNAILVGSYSSADDKDFRTGRDGYFEFSESTEGVIPGIYKLDAFIRTGTCDVISDIAEFEVHEKTDEQILTEMILKLENMKISLITYKEQTTLIKEFYMTGEYETDARKYIEVETLFDIAIESIDETKTIIRNNLDNPDIVKDAVRNNLLYIRDIIENITDILLSAE